jgi:hypothetical protein
MIRPIRRVLFMVPLGQECSAPEGIIRRHWRVWHTASRLRAEALTWAPHSNERCIDLYIHHLGWKLLAMKS